MEAIEQINDHVWMWADVLAWAAGTAGEVCVLLSERLFRLEGQLKP